MRTRTFGWAVTLLGIGLAAALAGFGAAFCGLTQYRAGFADYACVTAGLLATLYAFRCAFASLQAGRPMMALGRIHALVMTVLGVVSTTYGGSWAVRGIQMFASGSLRTALATLSGISLLAAGYGFSQAFRTIIRPWLSGKATKWR